SARHHAAEQRAGDRLRRMFLEGDLVELGEVIEHLHLDAGDGRDVDERHRNQAADKRPVHPFFDDRILLVHARSHHPVSFFHSPQRGAGPGYGLSRERAETAPQSYCNRYVFEAAPAARTYTWIALKS